MNAVRLFVQLCRIDSHTEYITGIDKSVRDKRFNGKKFAYLCFLSWIREQQRLKTDHKPLCTEQIPVFVFLYLIRRMHVNVSKSD